MEVCRFERHPPTAAYLANVRFLERLIAMNDESKKLPLDKGSPEGDALNTGKLRLSCVRNNAEELHPDAIMFAQYLAIEPPEPLRGTDGKGGPCG